MPASFKALLLTTFFGASVRAVVACLFVFASASQVAWGQNFRQLGTEFRALRKVTLPGDAKGQLAVVEFPSHGDIAPGGRNVAVISTRTRRPVASRVLQLGPGDFCRVAFELEPNTTSYDLFYGGSAPAADQTPEWTAAVGLLLETREFRSFNLNSVEELRRVFEQSTPIGGNYVDGVNHAGNPFSLRASPFLSRYSGTIVLPSSGEYAFYTSSQDCSFLLIDGQLVASAPGRHGPARQARPEMRKPVRLSAGPHRFEYYHAATSSEAVMAAAWEVNPSGERPRPEAIPAEAFQTGAIVRATAGPLARPDEPTAADFLYNVAGDVPLPDNPLHLVGVEFRIITPGDAASRSDIRWDFGDGQSSSQPNPVHVYLRPGLYPVTLTLMRGARPLVTTNRIQVENPRVMDSAKFHNLDMYLPILDTYDSAKLDGASLVQMVSAYFWKAEQLIADADDLERQAEETSPQAMEEPSGSSPARGTSPRPTPGNDPTTAREIASLRTAARAFLEKGVNAGKVAFLGPASATGEQDLYELVLLIGPIARDHVGDSRLAGQIWHGAAQRLSGERAARCEAMAADIALNDLLNPQAADTLLREAERLLGGARSGEVASLVRRVRGDHHATTGNREQARAAYREAQSMYQSHGSLVERLAWQGAHSRSAEQYLKAGQHDRAAVELRDWQDAYPADKSEGYLHLLMARYWQGRKLHAQAVALADQLLVVNSDSPYMDQLLMVSADCDMARGETPRALATLRSLVRDYPGSPLVEEARRRLAEHGTPP